VVVALAVVLGAIAFSHVWSVAHNPVRWTPDGLYYQARVLELRGASHDAAFERTFDGPVSASLRARDPHHSGNPTWVKYNEPFYERRIALPLAGAALYPVSGQRSLLYLSLAGYVASILALFAMLCLRFRLPTATAVALAAVFLPPLVGHSSYPLTDSWGLTLEILAFAAAILTFDRGLRWLPLWIAAIALLGFTRDSTWIPVLAVGWCALRYRTRSTMLLFGSGVAAALPALVLFQVPVRSLLALLVNNSNPSSDTSWSFIVRHYPSALEELVRSDVGFLRRGEWYTALFLVGGVLALLVLVWRGRARGFPATLLTAGTVFAFAYVLAAPSFSAFRLELVFLPMAAFGAALVTDLAIAASRARWGVLDRLPAHAPARASRFLTRPPS
jgi:hypothetical protein